MVRWPPDLHGRDWQTAWVRHPAGGAVSLRVTATDADRNEVGQTILDAAHRSSSMGAQPHRRGSSHRNAG